MEAPLGPGRGLPIPPTPLVGRERGLAAACGALLDEGVRLLTLTGPPGVGKTRLALAAGAALAPAFPDGLWFVPLAAVADSTLVAGAVAAAVGVPDAGDRALPERLAEALGSRRALLVLDNFEQLMAAAPLVAALCAACPELRVLVTSRRPLRLLGERELRVPPLAVPRPPAPGGGAAPRPTDDPPTPAVVLFLQRARDARPDAVLTGQDAEAVAEVCRRLDGLPLALELAAARLRHLTAPALLALLAPALPLLTGGARDLPARQRTLHDAIAWSYGLLEPDERAFFRRLGVFVGGCSIEGAAAIAGDWPAPDAGGAASRPADAARPAARLAALEQLAALVDHGLVQPGPAGDARFGLLETVREYALERLADSGELEAARRRHALHFLGLAERAAGAMHGTHQGAWLERLERERGNLRAALEWAIARGEAGPGARLVVALRWFWEIRGGATEGRRQSGALLSLPALASTADSRGRARLLAVAAQLAQVEADRAAAAALAAEGAALAAAAGAGAARADALLWLANARFRLGDPSVAGRTAASTAATASAGARALLEESLARWRELGVPWGVAQALEFLGMVARDAGDLPGARPRYGAALALRRELGDARGVAQTLGSLANLARLEGDHVTALACAEESLATARALGDRRRVATALGILAAVAQALGDAALARRHLEAQLVAAQQADSATNVALAALRLAVLAAGRGEATLAGQLYGLSLRRCVQLASRAGTVVSLAGLAAVAAGRGLPECAARLLGAAEASPAAKASLLMAGGAEVHAQYEQTVAAVRRALMAHPQAATWIEVGRRLPLERVVEEALALVEGAAAVGTEAGGPPPPGSPPAAGAPSATDRLTAREREVAVLVARGATNRQIAARLVIAERTAMRHVEHIFTKLGVHSRAEVGAWVAAQGLLAAADTAGAAE